MNILFSNGKVLTQSPQKPFANSVFVEGNKIKFVGKLSNFKANLPKYYEEINLDGKILLPGFIDTHTHFVSYASSKIRADLSGCTSISEMEKRLLEYKKKHVGKMEWISGKGWEKNLLKSENGFDRYFLDEIFPDTPVSLSSKDLHSFLCNSVALKKMGITSKTKLPEGSSIGYFANGELNGFLYERAWLLISDAQPSLQTELKERLVKEAIWESHKFGLTGLHSIEDEGAYNLFKSLREKNELNMRVCWHFPLEMFDEMIARGVKSYTGDDWLTIGGLKIFMDGSIGSRSAFMYHPYKGEPDNYGFLVRSEDEFYNLLVKAGKNGISVLTHSIGDRCNSIVINGIERAQKHPDLEDKDLFYRIEHLQCVLPEDVKRVAKHNIYSALQPIHIRMDAKFNDQNLSEHGKDCYPFRSLIDSGAVFGFGSDVPVESHNPFLGIYAAIERKSRNEPSNTSWIPEQKITAEEAIRAYTIWAAKASRQEDKFGSIVPGKFADLIVIDDYTEHDSTFWLQAKSYLTLVDGEIVYSRL